MAPHAPGVLADPAGVVADLVAGIELSLDRACMEDVVARVAGGRAKRRRLAGALLQRPLILTDGRSPAPRVVGDLLCQDHEATPRDVAVQAGRLADTGQL